MSTVRMTEKGFFEKFSMTRPVGKGLFPRLIKAAQPTGETHQRKLRKESAVDSGHRGISIRKRTILALTLTI